MPAKFTITIATSLAAFFLSAHGVNGQYTATYTYGPGLPDKSEGQGQSGTNACGTESSPTAMCQNVIVNSANDFCLWGPAGTNPAENYIGMIEQHVIAYCLNPGYGTRVFPSGTITNAHFVKVMSDTVSYVQVTGNGDFSKINIPYEDEGGELDPHSWTGLGNPEGGLVFTNAFTGSYEQTHEWTSFQSGHDYCIRACRDGPNARKWCEHIYDLLGCGYTVPGSHGAGFDDCIGPPAAQPGLLPDGSLYHQDHGYAPPFPQPGPTSSCQTFSTVGGGTAHQGLSTALASATRSGSASASGTGRATASGSASAAPVSTTGSGSGTSSRPAATSSSSGASGSAAAAVATGGAERVNGVVGGMGGVGVVAALGLMAVL